MAMPLRTPTNKSKTGKPIYRGRNLVEAHVPAIEGTQNRSGQAEMHVLVLRQGEKATFKIGKHKGISHNFDIYCVFDIAITAPVT